MRSSNYLVLLALTASLAAQGTIVSPLSCVAAEGDSNNIFPFGGATVRRYMQIHADLGTTPRVITKIGFRINTPTLSTNYTGTRTHDIEVYMGDGLATSQQLPNLTYDANYAAPKTTVLPRQLVTFGPTGQSVSPGPNPFQPELEITLATPFVYTGTAPLIWEIAYFGSTAAGTTAAYDADQSTSVTGPSTITGIGCPPTGGTTPMTHAYTINDTAGTLLMNGTITGGPANALALMAIGFSNPNAPAPGVVCSNIYTDGAIVQFLGITSATGTYTADNPTGAIIIPNTATGLTLFTQAFCIDPTNPGLFLIASNGRTATVPAVGTAEVNLVTRLWNTAGGTTATSAVFSTSTIGYALATQFTHL
jgi:hypothetical protein